MEKDIFEEAENAVESKPSFATWGQVTFDAYECVWPKGSMPIRFDAQIHKRSDRRLRIEIVVIALDEMNARFPTAEFKTLADSHDWAAVTLPSLKALNQPLATLNNAWAKVEKKGNGKKYPKKDKATGQPTGEFGENQDFLFLKIFQSQDECLADYLSDQAGEPATQASADAFPVDDAPKAAINVPAAPSAALVAQFAKAIVENAVKNMGKDVAAVTENVRVQIESSPFFGGKKLAELPDVMTMIIEAVK
jgi:hypothetical protein